MGAARGIYGAKITGGGSGGVVAVMGDKARLSAALAEIVGRYEREFGIRGQVFMGSSPGARQFRRLKIQVQRVERV
jgi:L-arabinokinase